VTDQKHRFRALRRSLRPSIELDVGFGRPENQDLTILPIRRGRARSHPQFAPPKVFSFAAIAPPLVTLIREIAYHGRNSRQEILGF